MTYPATRRSDVAEEHFGTRIDDPYRWLENDLRRDPEVAAWVSAQDDAARSCLDRLPGRTLLRQRLAALFDHERITAPEKRGERYFATRNPGLDEQPMLVLREGANGSERILISPARWSGDGATALAEWSVSEDGRRVAFATQEGGTDWRSICVLEVDSGEILPDEITRVRFSAIAWARDGAGFFYSCFPTEDGGSAFDAPVSSHAVYFHRIGTSQAEDRLVHATPAEPHLLHIAGVTEDGAYLAIYSSPGSGGSAPTIIDLATGDWRARRLVPDFNHYWTVFANLGTRLFLTTQKDAERGKVVTIDLADDEAVFHDVVAEQDAVLHDAALIGGRLLLSYIADARTRIERYRPDGTPDGSVDLPGPGSAGGFRGRATDAEAFFVFTSHDVPTTVFRYDVGANRRTVWAEPKVQADLGRMAVQQHFYASRDGTSVPMSVLRRKDITGPAPTILYGYGGYGISMIPYYAPEQIAWVEQGGVFAVANIRGGGEYGKAWHDAGRLQNKQNAFDDFIAAAEYLKGEGITSPEGLAIQGQSNGGLLVGAVVNQRPDLFAAALPGVGVMDMLRFARFTGGQFWMQDFGDPSTEADFRTLLAYSPLHNIRPGQAYPAVLVTTADTDDRVVPCHSFKYVAALQAADLGPRPRLLRIDRQAGHGAGKPTGRMIDEVADLWAFAARWTGLDLTSHPPSAEGGSTTGENTP